MAKRKSNRRRRAGGYQRRGGRPPASVRRPVRLDDLLLPAAATGTTDATPAPAQPAAQPVLRGSAHPEGAQIRAEADLPPRLEALPDLVDGPHVRLGALWAIVTFVALGAGVIATALWFGVAAGLAGAQAARSFRLQRRRPLIPLAAAGAGLLPLAATISAPAMVGAAAAVAVACLFYRPDPRHAAPVLTAAIALGFGLAAASPVLVRRMGLVEVLVLVSLVGVYDASAYLVGTGAARWWEGPAAGIAFMFAVTLAAAAVFVPPFEGASPWLMGALAAALAPLGPMLAPRLVADPRARVPAVKRLDSLLVLGPLWAAAAYVLL
jgi:hypothetical protein